MVSHSIIIWFRTVRNHFHSDFIWSTATVTAIVTAFLCDFYVTLSDYSGFSSDFMGLQVIVTGLQVSFSGFSSDFMGFQVIVTRFQWISRDCYGISVDVTGFQVDFKWISRDCYVWISLISLPKVVSHRMLTSWILQSKASSINDSTNQLV